MLRVIAAERAYPRTGTEIVKACIYKDDKLYLYDGEELFYQKEYFEDFPGLEYFVEQEKYDWCDFLVDKGDLITRNSSGDILLNDRPHKSFSKCSGEGMMSPVTLRLFTEFLKSCNRKNDQVVKDISDAYECGILKDQIKQCISKDPEGLLQDNFDKKITLYARLFGKNFVIDAVKKLLKSDENHKVERITFFFTRLFKLEYAGYLYVE